MGKRKAAVISIPHNRAGTLRIVSGGRKDLAEAGGKNPAKLDEVLRAVPAIIEKMLQAIED